MERKTLGQRGMSLVEVTIILMTLAILTAVAAPSINDYVQDARDVKVKEDVEAIGVSIARMVRDTGLPCMTKSFADGCVNNARVDLLVSEGTEPALAASATTTALTGGSGQDESINWSGTDEPAAGNLDTMLNQLVLNTPDYDDPNDKGSMFKGGPRAGLGWRGAYLSSSIGPDPWGNMYQSNTIFLGVTTNSAAGTAEGLLSSGWVKDVIVVSAGRNGIIETPFGGSTNGGSGTAVDTSDDVFYVVTGSTR